MKVTDISILVLFYLGFVLLVYFWFRLVYSYNFS